MRPSLSELDYEVVCSFPIVLSLSGDIFDLESSHVVPALIHKFVEARDRGDREVTVWEDRQGVS